MSANAVTIKINDRAKSLRFAESMTSGSIYQITIDGATISSGNVAIFTHCKKLVAYADITNSQGTLSTNTVELYEHIKSSPIGASLPLKVIVHKAGEEEYENVAIGDCFIINAGGTWSDNTTGIEAYTKTETDAKLAAKADLSHTHDQDDISGLEAALAAKADEEHTHPTSDISGFDAALAEKADEEHTHAQDDISGLEAALAAKADAATVNAELANKSSLDHTHPTVAPSTDADSTALAGAKSTAEFVNSSINNLAAFYITADEDGNAFATKAQLDSATKFYNSGEERIPTKNDYLIVLADEEHTTSAGFDPTTRYVYDGAQWAFQYVVNNTPFTQAQLNALNSGITSAKVAQIKDTDNTVTQASSNPVKSSGIWSWCKATFAAISHSHAMSAITDLVSTLASKVNKTGDVMTGTLQANASVYLYGVQSTLAFILDAAMENWLMFMWNGNTLITQGTVPLVFTNAVAFYGGLKIGNDDVATKAYVDSAVASAGWGYNGEINMTDAISIYNAQAGKNYYRAAEGDKYIKLPSGVQNISFVVTHSGFAGNTYITTDDEVVLATDTTSGFKTMLLTNGSSNSWMVTIRKVNPILLFVKKERILAA